MAPLVVITKSDLMARLAKRFPQLSAEDIYLADNALLDRMAHSLAQGDRIEIRGMGSFDLHFRAPIMGRNPKTGEPVAVAGKYVPYFKTGKELRKRVTERVQ